MRKFADISLAVEEVVVETQPLVRVHVTSMNLRDWCLCLQLLQEHLVEAFTFRRNSSSQDVEFMCGTVSGCRLTREHGRAAVSLSTRDLDFIRHFFLRYYRDGVAEVDHIDIETDGGGYIILGVEESVPPIPEEDVKRRLGMKTRRRGQ